MSDNTDPSPPGSAAAAESGENAIDKKKKSIEANKVQNSWKKFLISLFHLFLITIIASFIAVNLLFIRNVPAELFYPSNPCMPPYMSRIPPECDESIDMRYFNDDTDRIKQRSMYKRCVPSAFKVRWHEGLPPDIIKFLEGVQSITKKKQSFEYAQIANANKTYWEQSAMYASIMKFFQLYLRVIYGKAFINLRIQHQILHGYLPKDGRFTFLILLFIFIYLIWSDKYKAFLASIGSLYTIFVLFNVIMVTASGHTVQLLNPIFLTVFMPLICLIIYVFFLRDILYTTIFLPFINSNARKIVLCKLGDYWPLVSLLFVYFAIKNAGNYLDDTTVVAMWMVYIFFIIANRKKLFGPPSKSEAKDVCGDLKIFDINKT